MRADPLLFRVRAMLTLRELAELTGSELIGDPELVVNRARPFDLAEEGDITFAGDPKFLDRVGNSSATAVIVGSRLDADKALLIHANPKLAFARAIAALHLRARVPAGVSAALAAGEGARLGKDLYIHPRVTLGRDVVLGDRVTLYPGVVIGDNCKVGNDSIFYPNVTVYDGCLIGNRVIIQAGAVIGSDGFGFVPDEEGRQVKLLHLGGVRIEDDCEIGANCTIDRGGFGDTVIRRGVKLDNLIQVGHNCEIGENTVIAAQCGFSGGTRIGRNCVMAGQMGTVHHVTVGDRVIISAQAAVTKDVQPGSQVGGMIPARDIRAWRKSQVLYSRLPELVERLRHVEKELESRKAPNRSNGERRSE